MTPRITRRFFLFLASALTGCKSKTVDDTTNTITVRVKKVKPPSVDDDPWSQPRTRMYDRDLTEYCRRDVEVTMELMKLHNPELNESHREFWIIRTDMEAEALRAAHAQARRDGYRDIGGGVWERNVRRCCK